MRGSWHRLVLLALGLGLAACSQAPEDAQAPDVGVMPQFGTEGIDAGLSIAVNPNIGAVFVGGYVDQSLADIIPEVRRYNKSGTLSWSKRLDPYGGEVARLALAPGNTVVAAINGDPEVRIYKFSATGQQLWQLEVKSPASADPRARSAQDLQTDAAGNIYVAARAFYDDTTFLAKINGQGNQVFARSFSGEKFQVAPDGSIYAVRSGNVGDIGPITLYKYSSQAQLLWTKIIAQGNYSVSALRLSNDSLYLAGTKYYKSNGSVIENDGLVGRFTLNGGVKWLKSFGTKSSDYTNHLTLDAQGNVYVAGNTYGALAGSYKGEQDFFVRKYAPNAGVVWTKQYGTMTSDGARAIGLSSSSEIYTAGASDGNLGAGNKGNADGFLIRLDGSGNQIWVR